MAHFFRKILLAMVLATAAMTANAQCGIENKAFKSGEYLSYDLYFN